MSPEEQLAFVDPFGLTLFAAERFGLNPGDITRIEAYVTAAGIPQLVVTLDVLPPDQRPKS